jgi:predicted transcriptional regulator of viral defense system
MATKIQSLIELAGKQGVIRSADLRKRSIPTIYLHRLLESGRLVQRARGVYALPDADLGQHHDWEIASLKVPRGVLCLTTALAFHEIGTQSPRVVWMAIGSKAWQPNLAHPPVRFVRFSDTALRFGAVTVRSGNGALRVFTPAKTVADCFKYRRKIGIDVAVEALTEGWRARKFTIAELVAAAKVCRVERVMQPYLNMLT